MDAIVHITQQITSAKRNELSRVLAALNAIHSQTEHSEPQSSPSTRKKIFYSTQSSQSSEGKSDKSDE